MGIVDGEGDFGGKSDTEEEELRSTSESQQQRWVSCSRSVDPTSISSERAGPKSTSRLGR